MGDYDDERPSWRDIDKKRDRSSHVRQEKTEKTEGPKDRWKEARQKKALDMLFKGEKGTIEYQKLYNKIHKTYGSAQFLPAVQKYLEKYGLPDDLSTLLLVADTKDPDIVIPTIEKLLNLYGGLTPREKEDARRKVSILAMTDKAADVKERAREIADEMKSRA